MEQKLCFAFLIIFIGSINAEQCSSEFKTKPFCVVPYGVLMLDHFARSHIDCAQSCAMNVSCNSFFYISGASTCRRNEELLPNPSSTCGITEIYGQREQTACFTSTSLPTLPPPPPQLPPPNNSLPQSWDYLYYPYFYMHQPCMSGSDCINIPNTDCISQSICQCYLGYSFDWTTQTCVVGCAQYGHSYQIAFDRNMAGFDIQIIQNVYEEQCLDACTNYGPVCKTTTYNPSTMICNLKDQTAYSQLESIEVLLNTNIYTRDCLFQ